MAEDILGAFARGYEGMLGLQQRFYEAKTLKIESDIKKRKLEADLAALEAAGDPNSLRNRLAKQKLMNEYALSVQEGENIELNQNEAAIKMQEGRAGVRATYFQRFMENETSRGNLMAMINRDAAKGDSLLSEQEIAWYRQNAKEAPYKALTLDETHAKLAQSWIRTLTPTMQNQIAKLQFNASIARKLGLGKPQSEFDKLISLKLREAMSGGEHSLGNQDTDWEPEKQVGQEGFSASIIPGLGKKGVPKADDPKVRPTPPPPQIQQFDDTVATDEVGAPPAVRDFIPNVPTNKVGRSGSRPNPFDISGKNIDQARIQAGDWVMYPGQDGRQMRGQVTQKGLNQSELRHVEPMYEDVKNWGKKVRGKGKNKGESSPWTPKSFAGSSPLFPEQY